MTTVMGEDSATDIVIGEAIDETAAIESARDALARVEAWQDAEVEA